MEMGSCLEEENGALCISQLLSNSEDFEQGNEALDSLLPSSPDKMPFLQMLQAFPSHHHHQQQPNFQLLLKLQHQKSMLMSPFNDELNNHHFQSTNIISCVTNSNNDIAMELQSSAIAPQISTMDPNNNVEKSTPKSTTSPRSKGKKCKMVGTTKEKKKRKRTTTKESKNKEQVENQRMTHIAVERNRRRQMNQHLNALRSLMPPSYVQRGDQASIIGGAIDLVKELEQVLESLQGQKRGRQYQQEQSGEVSGSSTTSSPSNMFGNKPSTSSSIISPSCQYEYCSHESIEGGKLNQELRAENKSDLADIQVIVIQNHVNLKIRCQRRPGQLLHAILALEQLSFTVLHLNITSFHSFVYYSFNLKIEEECKVGSAEEVASAVHQIFSLINSC